MGSCLRRNDTPFLNGVLIAVLSLGPSVFQTLAVCSLDRVQGFYKRLFQHPDDRVVLEALIALPQEHRTVQRKFDGAIQQTTLGFPTESTIVETNGHTFVYFTDRQGVQIIATTNEIQAGWRPFEKSGRGSRQVFEEVTGVFLTTPDAYPKDVGVEPQKTYRIAVSLPQHPYIIQLSHNTFVVPSFPITNRWITSLFEQWLERTDESSHTALRELPLIGLFERHRQFRRYVLKLPVNIISIQNVPYENTP